MTKWSLTCWQQQCSQAFEQGPSARIVLQAMLTSLICPECHLVRMEVLDDVYDARRVI